MHMQAQVSSARPSASDAHAYLGSCAPGRIFSLLFVRVTQMPPRLFTSIMFTFGSCLVYEPLNL
jgi:hypothetical protein